MKFAVYAVIRSFIEILLLIKLFVRCFRFVFRNNSGEKAWAFALMLSALIVDQHLFRSRLLKGLNEGFILLFCRVHVKGFLLMLRSVVLLMRRWSETSEFFQKEDVLLCEVVIIRRMHQGELGHFRQILKGLSN